MASQIITVGRFGAAHGVQGWIKVQSFTDEPKQLGEYQQWFSCSEGDSSSSWELLEVEKIQWHGDKLVAKFEKYSDRDAVKQLTGRFLGVYTDEMAELEEGEYYWHELIGMKVFGRYQGSDVCFGQVADLLATGANDVLIVRGKDCKESLDKKERLIPYLPGQVVEAIDLGGKVIRVNWDADF